jgi:beta-phosphoglucomutase-like phosphatase (HAD superfamily)
MVLRAIVFDFDGVIANSEPLHFGAFRDVLADEGVTLTEADYYAHYLGYDDVGVFRAVDAKRRAWTASDVTALVARKAVRLEALERDVSVLFPGAADAIRRAAAAVPIAIASGALGAEIRRVLDRERLAGYFTAIVAAEDTPRSKPAPDPYLRAVSLLAAAHGGALAAADCVAIEDSRWGLESARAAGLKTLAVTNTYDASAFDGAADAVIASLASLDLDAVSRLFAA